MRVAAICFLFISQLTTLSAGQQAASNGKTVEAICTFDDGKEMKIQYTKAPASYREDFREGKLWEPGGAPMFLFTQAPLSLGSTSIPGGAYSVYVIPEKQTWTLVVNKNVTAGSKYDEKEDVGRTTMEIGQNETPVKEPQIVFAHMAPKQCNLRLYYEKVGAWAEFREK
jgi:Protein of unknown function (DUF2911)